MITRFLNIHIKPPVRLKPSSDQWVHFSSKLIYRIPVVNQKFMRYQIYVHYSPLNPEVDKGDFVLFSSHPQDQVSCMTNELASLFNPRNSYKHGIPQRGSHWLEKEEGVSLPITAGVRISRKREFFEIPRYWDRKTPVRRKTEPHKCVSPS